jgi:hypothetical protein
VLLALDTQGREVARDSKPLCAGDTWTIGATVSVPSEQPFRNVERGVRTPLAAFTPNGVVEVLWT